MQHSRTPRLGWIAIGTIILFSAGCVKESVEGNVHTFTFELWVSASMIAGGICAAAAGWFLRKGRLGWILMIGGPLFAIILGPSTLLDKAVVDDQQFQSKGGIWGMTAQHEATFDDVTLARITKEITAGRRGRRKTSYYLVLEKKSGEPSKLPLGNQTIEAATPLIIDQLRAREIQIIDQSQ